MFLLMGWLMVGFGGWVLTLFDSWIGVIMLLVCALLFVLVLWCWYAFRWLLMWCF